MASNGWYSYAIEGLQKANKQEKVFIWMDDGCEMYEHESVLRDRLDWNDGEEEQKELMDLLYESCEPDCDYFVYCGERFSYYTIENCDNEKQYIIIMSSTSNNEYVEKMLTEFYGENLSDTFEELEHQSWEAMDNCESEFMVAFRGGYGYTYKLWKVKENTNNEEA